MSSDVGPPPPPSPGTAVFDENTVEDVIDGLKVLHEKRKPIYKDSYKLFTPKDFGESDQFKVKRSNGDILKIKDFAPRVFHQIRLNFGVNEDAYLNSFKDRNNLTPTKGQGKSGAFFIFTNDKQFILKTATGEERDFLMSILENYWQHLQKYPNTLLPRYYGVYSMKHEGIGGVTRFIVMNNLFNTPFELVEKYDLKGSFMGRYVSDKKRKPGAILKDLDIEHDKRKLYFPKHLRIEFIEQLKKDSNFLASFKVMDYSLLLGIAYETPENKEKNEAELKKLKENPFVIPELVQNKFQQYYNGAKVTRPDGGTEVYYVGIIDILIQYVAKKKLEHLLKTVAYPGEEVSVVNPKYYSDRFFDFIKNLVYVPEEEENTQQ
uniref:PIPK domain-containing protein n=1 Tax=Arcella intermedia TaxID=1963864 RepID=A0A6B2L4Z5_9EUKA